MTQDSRPLPEKMKQKSNGLNVFLDQNLRSNLWPSKKVKKAKKNWEVYTCISRPKGHSNLKFWFYQSHIYLNKCAKFYQYLGRCFMGLGSGKACADLPHGSGTMNYCKQVSDWLWILITGHLGSYGDYKTEKNLYYPDRKKLCGSQAWL